MRLFQIQITNYRGLKNVSIPLSQFVCTTGENNGGKSSVLQAMSHYDIEEYEEDLATLTRLDAA